jgi:hypothetical protein
MGKLNQAVLPSGAASQTTPKESEKDLGSKMSGTNAARRRRWHGRGSRPNQYERALATLVVKRQ